MGKMKFSVSPLEMYSFCEEKKYTNVTVLFFSLLYNDLITYEKPYTNFESVSSKDYTEKQEDDSEWVRQNERIFKLVEAIKIQEKFNCLYEDERKCLLELFKYKNNIFASSKKIYELNEYIYNLYKPKNVFKRLFNHSRNKLEYEKVDSIKKEIKSIIEMQDDKNQFDIEKIKSIMPYIFYTEDYEILINKIEKMGNKEKIYREIYKEYLDNKGIIDFFSRGHKTTW